MGYSSYNINWKILPKIPIDGEKRLISKNYNMLLVWKKQSFLTAGILFREN